MSNKRDGILNYIYEAIGNTPMVRLNRVPQDEGIECQMFGKCEFMNPANSVKDRISCEMFLAAEREGKIKPGDTVIEATSGNAGIGLACMAACKGYKMLITIPDKNAGEKFSVLNALGAQLVPTPSEYKTFEEGSHYMLARKLQKDIPNSHLLNQYTNPNNPGAHYKTSGQEIYDQCEGKIDYVFIGVGTGGTISGIAKKLKELDPNIKVIGIDPMGSIMAEPAELNTVSKPYFVEGIGHDFVPESLDRTLIDTWVKTDDPESLRLARDLIKKEGLLCGASSGSVMEGAIRYLKENGHDKNKDLRCVVMLADSIRNYLSKFCSDEWMVKKGFLPTSTLVQTGHLLYGKTIADLEVKRIPYFDDRLTVGDCLDAFAKGDLAVPLLNDGKIKGIVTRQSLLNGMMTKRLTNSHSATNAITKDVAVVPYDTDLSVIDAFLKKEEVVFVQKLNEKGKIQELYGVTKLDLIRLLRDHTKELI
jgi:cystathionine beta-synthase